MDTTSRPPTPMPPPPPPPPGAAAPAGIVVGIDVCKERLDLARSDTGDRVVTFANDAAGIAAVVRLLLAAPAPVAAVVIESTGGLERPLVEALLEAGLPVALVHPGRVRHFAKGLGVESKTDRIDARVLVRFGQLAAPRLAERRSRNEAELRDLLACRRQLTVTRTQQSNRRGATASRAALKAIDAVIKALDRQIASLDEQVRALVDAELHDDQHLDDEGDAEEKRDAANSGVGAAPLEGLVIDAVGEQAEQEKQRRDHEPRQQRINVVAFVELIHAVGGEHQERRMRDMGNVEQPERDG